MKLSLKAWKISKEIYDAIIIHPFNQELMKGTLSKDRFSYYIEQDSIYLHDFARCHAIIASKAPFENIRQFLKYSEGTFVVEQEIVHQFFHQAFNFKKTNKLTLATLGYTSYLIKICSQEPIEVAIAAILPCFWVYKEVGLYITKHCNTDNNPYQRWIETYASKEFSDSVDEVINIFDELSLKTTEQIREKMLNAFYKSTCLEWHFWNDAYQMSSFEPIA
jgi:thiaminase/transcriptional activator TenA